MVRLLWLQGICCGGETVSLLNAEQPDVLTIFELLGVDLVWHPSFHRLQGEQADKLLEKHEKGEDELDILVVEGAIPTGDEARPRAFGPVRLSIAEQVARLAHAAKYVMAVGTCACFGGVVCGRGSPGRATGVQYFRRYAGDFWGRTSNRARGCR